MTSSSLHIEKPQIDKSVERIKPPKSSKLPGKLRNLELVLLIFAFGINLSAIVLVQWGALDEIDVTPLLLNLSLCAVIFALHLTVRMVAADADPLIIPIATVLNGIGIALIYRIDLGLDQDLWDSSSSRQVLWSAISVSLAIVVLIVIRNHRMLLRYTYIAGLLTTVLLLLPMVPGLGRTINGAQVWISIGTMSFQPGEMAKLTLAIFMAGYLVSNRDSLSMVGKKFMGVSLPRVRDLGPLLLFWLMAMSVIVFQQDLGTALLYFGIFLVIVYVATGRLMWVILGLGMFLGGALVASQTLEYVRGRFNHWLDPFNQELYEGVHGSYQIVQGLFGMAQGGLVGTGLGQGRPQITPLAQSDYIFSSIAEELGLAGVFILLSLYMLLVGRGLRISFAARDDFGKLLAIGMTFLIALQIFIVIGGVTRVIPLTGLTAPFLAAGGSSLLANWIIVALFLRISDTIRNQPRMVIQ
ncbi:FtsW/RodA/SpoVE family cell cycle protein [Lysinibacter sp. HNR]|uniref:FtsW/RodA/SpoVE family cell cycle protein n=1 Tax=Lysinibacter sp. HNR TaxID=3031408 RepID=UPI002435E3B5|nr:FtsW/RodA/SpoVE family cell cycle protein [Lysinibacter sp. HNR]WGD37363.1 FtsW/RodA/SpoVE family cell cycle protein [Lysinibacter sp. HNR]